MKRLILTVCMLFGALGFSTGAFAQVNLCDEGDLEVCLNGALFEVSARCDGDYGAGEGCIVPLYADYDDTVSGGLFYAAVGYVDFDGGGCDDFDQEVFFTETAVTTMKSEGKATDVLKGNGKDDTEITMEWEFKNLDEACEIDP